MLAPTPLLKPSPLDIGGLFAGSFAALKRHFGLFALIALLPTVVAIVAIGAAVLAAVLGIGMERLAGDRLNAGALVAAGALFLGGLLVAALAQLKSYGMLSVAAYEVAQGGRPDFRGILARTRGFLPRMAVVIAIGAAAAVLVYGMVLGVLFAMVTSAGSSDSDPFRALAAVFGGMLLLLLVAVPVGVYLSTKLLYTIPAVAIEQLDGVAGLKRSWNLTRGQFWRTFGYYLLASLAVSAISYTVSMVTQVVTLPVSMGASAGSSDLESMAALGAMLPLIGLSVLLQLAVQVVSLPFLQAYTTYMYLDQVRRNELPPAPYGGGQQPYYAQPGPYPAAAPGHPQGWANPQQGWASPAQGWANPQQAPWPPAGPWQPPSEPPR